MDFLLRLSLVHREISHPKFVKIRCYWIVIGVRNEWLPLLNRYQWFGEIMAQPIVHFLLVQFHYQIVSVQRCME